MERQDAEVIADQMLDIIGEVVKICVHGTDSVFAAQIAILCVSKALKEVATTIPDFQQQQGWVEDMVHTIPVVLILPVVIKEMNKAIEMKMAARGEPLPEQL